MKLRKNLLNVIIQMTILIVEFIKCDNEKPNKFLLELVTSTKQNREYGLIINENKPKSRAETDEDLNEFVSQIARNRIDLDKLNINEELDSDTQIANLTQLVYQKLFELIRPNHINTTMLISMLSLNSIRIVTYSDQYTNEQDGDDYFKVDSKQISFDLAVTDDQRSNIKKETQLRADSSSSNHQFIKPFASFASSIITNTVDLKTGSKRIDREYLCRIKSELCPCDGQCILSLNLTANLSLKQQNLSVKFFNLNLSLPIQVNDINDNLPSFYQSDIKIDIDLDNNNKPTLSKNDESSSSSSSSSSGSSSDLSNQNELIKIPLKLGYDLDSTSQNRIRTYKLIYSGEWSIINKTKYHIHPASYLTLKYSKPQDSDDKDDHDETLWIYLNSSDLLKNEIRQRQIETNRTYLLEKYQLKANDPDYEALQDIEIKFHVKYLPDSNSSSSSSSSLAAVGAVANRQKMASTGFTLFEKNFFNLSLIKNVLLRKRGGNNFLNFKLNLKTLKEIESNGCSLNNLKLNLINSTQTISELALSASTSASGVGAGVAASDKAPNDVQLSNKHAKLEIHLDNKSNYLVIRLNSKYLSNSSINQFKLIGKCSDNLIDTALLLINMATGLTKPTHQQQHQQQQTLNGRINELNPISLNIVSAINDLDINETSSSTSSSLQSSQSPHVNVKYYEFKFKSFNKKEKISNDQDQQQQQQQQQQVNKNTSFITLAYIIAEQTSNSIDKVSKSKFKLTREDELVVDEQFGNDQQDNDDEQEEETTDSTEYNLLTNELDLDLYKNLSLFQIDEMRNGLYAIKINKNYYDLMRQYQQTNNNNVVLTKLDYVNDEYSIRTIEYLIKLNLSLINGHTDDNEQTKLTNTICRTLLIPIPFYLLQKLASNLTSFEARKDEDELNDSSSSLTAYSILSTSTGSSMVNQSSNLTAISLFNSVILVTIASVLLIVFGLGCFAVSLSLYVTSKCKKKKDKSLNEATNGIHNQQKRTLPSEMSTTLTPTASTNKLTDKRLFYSSIDSNVDPSGGSGESAGCSSHSSQISSSSPSIASSDNSSNYSKQKVEQLFQSKLTNLAKSYDLTIENPHHNHHRTNMSSNFSNQQSTNTNDIMVYDVMPSKQVYHHRRATEIDLKNNTSNLISRIYQQTNKFGKQLVHNLKSNESTTTTNSDDKAQHQQIYSLSSSSSSYTTQSNISSNNISPVTTTTTSIGVGCLGSGSGSGSNGSTNTTSIGDSDENLIKSKCSPTLLTLKMASKSSPAEPYESNLDSVNLKDKGIIYEWFLQSIYSNQDENAKTKVNKRDSVPKSTPSTCSGSSSTSSGSTAPLSSTSSASSIEFNKPIALKLPNIPVDPINLQPKSSKIQLCSILDEELACNGNTAISPLDSSSLSNKEYKNELYRNSHIILKNAANQHQKQINNYSSPSPSSSSILKDSLLSSSSNLNNQNKFEPIVANTSTLNIYEAKPILLNKNELNSNSANFITKHQQQPTSNLFNQNNNNNNVYSIKINNSTKLNNNNNYVELNKQNNINGKELLSSSSSSNRKLNKNLINNNNNNNINNNNNSNTNTNNKSIRDQVIINSLNTAISVTNLSNSKNQFKTPITDNNYQHSQYSQHQQQHQHQYQQQQQQEINLGQISCV